MRVVVSCSGKFHAFALVEQLEKNGVEVTFFTSYSSIANPFFIRFAKRIDKEIINPKSIKTNIIFAILLKIFRRSPQVVNNLFDLWVSRNLRKLNADVFIGWSGMSLNSIKVAKSKGWTTVLERGSTHIEFQNQILKEEYTKRGKFFSIDRNTISKELNEYALSDAIVIPSKFVEKTFLDKGVNQKKLFVNHFGASSFFKKRNARKDECFRVLYLGTLSIRKGAYYLFEAIQELKSLDIEFWFIGKIDNEVTDLYNILKKLPNVKFFGHVDHYKLNDLIEKCSVAIHPSLEEGQSMVINQVMKVGVPFIATPNSGAEELITHLKTGIIVEPKSTMVLSKAISNLFNNRDKLRKLTDNVAEMGIIENSWDAYGARYLVTINTIYMVDSQSSIF